jgi:hypothetical protein
MSEIKAVDNDPTGNIAGTESSLSSWVGPYVTDMLGKGQAIANMPYQAYTGPLTAGASDLQNTAFKGLAGLAMPGTPTAATPYAAETTTAGAFGTNATGTNTFGANQFGTNAVETTSFLDADNASKYMNPYLQQVLAPQQREAIKQAEQQRIAAASRLTQAGAYGGSRQGIMESEGARNLMTQLSDITGQGYASAFGDAQKQYNAEEMRRLEQANLNEKSRLGQLNLDEDRRLRQLEAGEERRLGQFNTGEDRRLGQLNEDERRRLGQFNLQEGDRRSQFNTEAERNQSQLEAARRYGLDLTSAQARIGETQRAIEAEGIAADKSQFEEERDFGAKQVQYLQSLLQGLPLEALTTSYIDPSSLSELTGGVAGISNLWDLLKEITGQSTRVPPTPDSSPTT